ncbi:hypothetical protein DFQ30_004809, partial [Apophysomyces sp. BC1015]
VVVMRVVHALCDVRRLLVICDQHRAAPVVDAEIGVVVADTTDRVPRDLDVVDIRVCRDLAGQHHQPGVAQRLGRHTGIPVLRQDRIEDCVGNLVRMAFGYGFRGKEIVVRHFVGSSEVGCVLTLPASGRSGDALADFLSPGVASLDAAPDIAPQVVPLTRRCP